MAGLWIGAKRWLFCQSIKKAAVTITGSRCLSSSCVALVNALLPTDAPMTDVQFPSRRLWQLLVNCLLQFLFKPVDAWIAVPALREQAAEQNSCHTKSLRFC